MDESRLEDHPKLKSFFLSDVRYTGTEIGRGAYGFVMEVEWCRTRCAAKAIHDTLIADDNGEEEIRTISTKFIEECELMGNIRHPNIVQFLGVCSLPRVKLPALVMELMITSLQNFIEENSEIEIPLSIKCSFVKDVCQGIKYLHSKSIIHRDLTASNVLVNSNLTCKLSDLGVARFLPDSSAIRLTKAPGNPIYMPPEAIESVPKYNEAIDIFSLGVLVIFIVTQENPTNLLTPTMTERKKLVARNELERRDHYMQKIYQSLSSDHPLVCIIKECLENIPEKRPPIDRVLHLLKEARDRDKTNSYATGSLVVNLLKMITQANQEKEEFKNETREGLREKEAELQRVRSYAQSQQNQIEILKREILALQKQPLKMTALTWKGIADLPKGVMWEEAVVINRIIHIGSGGKIDTSIQEYHTDTDIWGTPLKSTQKPYVRMTSMNSQLVLMGGFLTTTVAVLNDDRTWDFPYPDMPNNRCYFATTSYQHFFITAGGITTVRQKQLDIVEILDIRKKEWFTADPLPFTASWLTSAVVGDTWFLCGQWKDKQPHLLSTSLETLVKRAIDGKDTNPITPTWREVTPPPVKMPTLVAVQNTLLALGGEGPSCTIYKLDPSLNIWKENGELPIPLMAHCCTALPSGEIFVAGGETHDRKAHISNKAWIGTFI